MVTQVQGDTPGGPRCTEVCACLSRRLSGPTGRVVTGTIPAAMFVCTEALTHPNNQELWAFLIPAQSQ